MVLVVGVVFLIVGQLWILRRRQEPTRLLAPVQGSSRRNFFGSSTMKPKSSTSKVNARSVVTDR
jgi:hypothetical protein